ncbi:MAG: hypothetical protein E7199_05610 [Schwartzia succinivorans]|nr:hypothetical protein [Schwartzia succinivorans]
MGKKQLITTPDVSLIDCNADSFILSDEILERVDVVPALMNNYSVLKEELNPECYLGNLQDANALAWKWARRIGKGLNEKYNLCLDDDHWRYTLHLFLMSFLQELLAKLHKYKQIDEHCIFLKRYEFEINKKRSSDFYYSFDFHSVMWGEILRFYGHEEIVLPLVVKKDQEKEDNTKRKRPFYKRAVTAMKLLKDNPRYFFDRVKAHILSTESEMPFPDGGGEVLVIESRLPKEVEKRIVSRGNGSIEICGIQPFVIESEEIINKTGIDYDEREEFFSNLEIDDDIDRLIVTMLPKFIPKSLFEAFGNLYARASDLCSLWRYSKIYTCAAFSEVLDFCWGIMKKRGTQICDMQHAMTYTTNYYVGFNEYETFDRFVTWGWTTNDKFFADIKPAAMTRQPVISINKVKKRDKILLLMCQITILTPVGYYFGNYSQRQKEFISALSDEVRKKLVIRMQEAYTVTDIKIWCEKNYPDVKFEDLNDISFSDSVLESELVIADYYGSAPIEALLLGVPFVMYNGLHVVRFTPGYVQFLERMEKLGIYAKDGRTMAKMINSHSNYDEWLSSPEIVDFFNDYKNSMTNLDKDVVNVWYDEFIGG